MLKRASIPVTSLFTLLAAGCAHQGEYTIVRESADRVDIQNCLVWTDTKQTTSMNSEQLVESYSQLRDFAVKCQNYTLMAMLIRHELDNPNIYPLVTATYLTMMANADESVNAAMNEVLAKRNMNTGSLRKRFAETQEQIYQAQNCPPISTVTGEQGFRTFTVDLRECGL